MTTRHNPPHPGALLREYIGSMPVGEAAKRLHIARSTLSRILNAAPRSPPRWP